MIKPVIVQHENERGCGFRSTGANDVGIYLVGDPIMVPCSRLPFPLTVCPCCGAGVKPSRGFTWINPSKLFLEQYTPKCAENCQTGSCHMNTHRERAGLMWIGSSYYPTPHHFINEARAMGISKKIGSVPNGFEFEHDIVYLAHRQAVANFDQPFPDDDEDQPYTPGVIMAFMPHGIDLVIRENKIPEKALNIMERVGPEFCRLVQVVKETQTSMDLTS